MSAPGTNAYGLSTPNFTEILGGIVDVVSANLTPSLSALNTGIVGVNYLYGTPKAIIAQLQGWNTDPVLARSKYPLVALFQPFEETKGGRPDVAAIDKLRIIIAGLSDPKLLTFERYINNFNPVLYPIYNELIKQLEISKVTGSQIGKIPHIKVDWPMWDDGNDKNPFVDWLDIIEIKDMKLNVRYVRC